LVVIETPRLHGLKIPQKYSQPFCRLIDAIGAQSIQSPAKGVTFRPTAVGNSFVFLGKQITPLPTSVAAAIIT
jgi:hypothetical protein